MRRSAKSENDRINTGDLWWAWVDLNHRPRPYQERDLRNTFATFTRGRPEKIINITIIVILF